MPDIQPTSNAFGVNLYGQYGLARGPHGGGGASFSYCARLSDSACLDVGAGFSITGSRNADDLNSIREHYFGTDYVLANETLTRFGINVGIMGFPAPHFGIGLSGQLGHASSNAELSAQAVTGTVAFEYDDEGNPLEGLVETSLDRFSASVQESGVYYGATARLMLLFSNSVALYTDLGFSSLPPVFSGRDSSFELQSGLRFMF